MEGPRVPVFNERKNTMIDLETLDLRTLPTRSLQSISKPIDSTNNGLAEINKNAIMIPTIFYKEVIKKYVKEFMDWLKPVGPGVEVRLVKY